MESWSIIIIMVYFSVVRSRRPVGASHEDEDEGGWAGCVGHAD
jgi:hypothetical protein